MTYKKDDALDALFKRYWKWEAAPENARVRRQNSKGRDPSLMEPVREKKEGAQWYQIRDAVKKEAPDPTGQSDMTMAEAAALFSITPRQFKDLIRDGLIEGALLDGAGARWTLEAAAEVLNVSVEEGEQMKALANRPSLFPIAAIRFSGNEGATPRRPRGAPSETNLKRAHPALPITAAYESEKEKARRKRDEKFAKKGKSSTAESRKAERRLDLMAKVAKEIGKAGILPESTTGQKTRFIPAVLIDWANRHPLLHDWETRRPENQPIAVDPSIATVIRYIQVTVEGKLNVYNDGLNGHVEHLDLGVAGRNLMRKALKAAGFIELDKRGNLMRLESNPHTFSEALALPWRDPGSRDAWLEAYTGALRHWSEWLNEHAEAARAAAEGWKQEGAREGLTDKLRQRLQVKAEKASAEAKRANEWSNRARAAALDASLPSPGTGPKPVRF